MKKQQNLNSQVLVSGSLVFDTIFDLENSIGEQIVLEKGKISKQNLMFTAKEKQVYFGGTAGNICYGLQNLDSQSIAVSVVGRDFGEYQKHLKHLGVIDRVFKDEKAYTATFYAMSDTKREQIGIFQGGAYLKHVDDLSFSRLLKSSDWSKIKVGIFSAGTAKSIVSGLREFKKNKKNNALSIFDPGQIFVWQFTKELLLEALKNSDVFIANDTEFAHLKNKFGIKIDDLFSFGLKFAIETKGGDGSVLYQPNTKPLLVKALKVKKVIDPTGAGDAYRAGLISGILEGKSLIESMKIGSKLGALCVQTLGGQTYKI